MARYSIAFARGRRQPPTPSKMRRKSGYQATDNLRPGLNASSSLDLTRGSPLESKNRQEKPIPKLRALKPSRQKLPSSGDVGRQSFRLDEQGSGEERGSFTVPPFTFSRERVTKLREEERRSLSSGWSRPRSASTSP